MTLDPSLIKMRAARYSVITAMSLAMLKLVTGLVTGSLAVIASAVDSLLDLVMSAVNFVAIRQAEQPADASHPFGHGKYETLATLIQSLVISGSGIWIIVEAIHRLQSGSKIERVGEGIVVLAVSVLVSLWISRYLRRIGKETESSALSADSLHFAMDVYTNLALMVGLIVLSFVRVPWLDPLMSLLVALYILKEAISLIRHALRDMLDAELPESIRSEILRLAETYRGDLLDIHNLRTRRAGSQKIMDFHLTVCRHLSVEQAHEIADHLENRIRKKIRGADVTIHIEPCEKEDCPGRAACREERSRLADHMHPSA